MRQIARQVAGEIYQQPKQSKWEKAVDLAAAAINTAGHAKQAYDYLSESYNKSFPSKKELKKEIKKEVSADMNKRNPYIQPIPNRNRNNRRNNYQRPNNNYNPNGNQPRNFNPRNRNRRRNFRARRPRSLLFRSKRIDTVRRGGRNIRTIGLGGRQVVNGRVQTTIHHKEYIATVNCGSTYIAITSAINPGLPGIFPWLSQVALAYEKYTINSMSIIYENVTGYDDSGTIWMAFGYDPDDIGLTSRYNNPEVIASMEGCRDGDIKNRMVLNLDRKCFRGPSNGAYYTRSGAVSSDDETRWYDPAYFVVATLGDNVTTCGRLFISYSITFFEAVPNSSPLSSFLYSTTCDATNPLLGSSEYCANTPITFNSTAKTQTFVRDFRGYLWMFATGTVFVDGSSVFNLAVSGGGASIAGFSFVCGGTTTQQAMWQVTCPEGSVLTWSAGTATTVTNTRIVLLPIFVNLVTPTLPPSAPPPGLRRGFEERAVALSDLKNVKLIQQLLAKLEINEKDKSRSIDNPMPMIEEKVEDDYYEASSDPGETIRTTIRKLPPRRI